MLIKYVKYFFLSLFFLLSFLISAQNNLNGVVYEKLQNGDKKPLSGVNIYWKDFPESGSISKDNGNYSILEPFSYPSELVFSYVGYKTTIMNILDSSFLETSTVPLNPGVVGLNFNSII